MAGLDDPMQVNVDEILSAATEDDLLALNKANLDEIRKLHSEATELSTTFILEQAKFYRYVSLISSGSDAKALHKKLMKRSSVKEAFTALLMEWGPRPPAKPAPVDEEAIRLEIERQVRAEQATNGGTPIRGLSKEDRIVNNKSGVIDFMVNFTLKALLQLMMISIAINYNGVLLSLDDFKIAVDRLFVGADFLTLLTEELKTYLTGLFAEWETEKSLKKLRLTKSDQSDEALWTAFAKTLTWPIREHLGPIVGRILPLLAHACKTAGVEKVDKICFDLDENACTVMVSSSAKKKSKTSKKKGGKPKKQQHDDEESSSFDLEEHALVVSQQYDKKEPGYRKETIVDAFALTKKPNGQKTANECKTDEIMLKIINAETPEEQADMFHGHCKVLKTVYAAKGDIERMEQIRKSLEAGARLADEKVAKCSPETDLRTIDGYVDEVDVIYSNSRPNREAAEAVYAFFDKEIAKLGDEETHADLQGVINDLVASFSEAQRLATAARNKLLALSSSIYELRDAKAGPAANGKPAVQAVEDSSKKSKSNEDEDEVDMSDFT